MIYKKQLIILDRDGVINHDNENYIRSLDDWEPIPGSLEAIAELSKQYIIAIATNQSGIARKLTTIHQVETIHRILREKVKKLGGFITMIEFCPHLPTEACACRKPKPGMLQNIINKTQHLPVQSWMVGDSFKDIQAGAAIGCQTALVKTGNGLQTLEQKKKELKQYDTKIFNDLYQFYQALCHDHDSHR